MKELKIGQEIDARIIDDITLNEDTRELTVKFTSAIVDDIWYDTDTLFVKENESIDKILNHKWEI